MNLLLTHAAWEVRTLFLTSGKGRCVRNTEINATWWVYEIIIIKRTQCFTIFPYCRSVDLLLPPRQPRWSVNTWLCLYAEQKPSCSQLWITRKQRSCIFCENLWWFIYFIFRTTGGEKQTLQSKWGGKVRLITFGLQGCVAWCWQSGSVLLCCAVWVTAVSDTPHCWHPLTADNNTGHGC